MSSDGLSDDQYHCAIIVLTLLVMIIVKLILVIITLAGGHGWSRPG